MHAVSVKSSQSHLWSSFGDTSIAFLAHVSQLQSLCVSLLSNNSPLMTPVGFTKRLLTVTVPPHYSKTADCLGYPVLYLWECWTRLCCCCCSRAVCHLGGWTLEASGRSVHPQPVCSPPCIHRYSCPRCWYTSGNNALSCCIHLHL